MEEMIVLFSDISFYGVNFLKMLFFSCNVFFVYFQAVYKEDMLRRDIEDLQKRYQVLSLFFCLYLLQISFSHFICVFGSFCSLVGFL